MGTLKYFPVIVFHSDTRIQRYIRGSGLAYGASVSLDIEAGLTNFSLYRVSVDLMCYTQRKLIFL